MYLILSWECLQIRGAISIILRGILSVPRFETLPFACAELLCIKRNLGCALLTHVYLPSCPLVHVPCPGWESQFPHPESSTWVSRRPQFVDFLTLRFSFSMEFPRHSTKGYDRWALANFDSVLRFLLSRSRILAPHAVGTPTTTSYWGHGAQ